LKQKRFYMLLAALPLIFILWACAPSTPTTVDKRSQWETWAATNKPESPVIEVAVGIPATSISNTVYLDMIAPTAIKWEVYVDGGLFSSIQGPHLLGTIPLGEGAHIVRVTAVAEKAPPQDMIAYGPAISISEVTYSVMIDTLAPEVVLEKSYPEGKSFVLEGLLKDASSGVCCVIVSGVDTTVTVSEDGKFRLLVPFEKIGVATTINLIGYDKLNNATSVLVPIQLPANRWERISSDGEWVDVNVTPGFDPFDASVVGLFDLVKGYGGDYWVQYKNGIPVGTPMRESSTWGYLKFGAVAVVVIGLISLIAFVFWQATALPRAMGKAMSNIAVRPPVTNYPATIPRANTGLDKPLRTKTDVINELFVSAFISWANTKPALLEDFKSFWRDQGFEARVRSILNGEDKK
jgi:hypothetical protein